MISERLQKALSQHINYELYSSYLYLSMSAWFERKGLRGSGHWMQRQAQEELVHVHRFFNYLNERLGTAERMLIEAPPPEWESPLQAFEAAYEHECRVSTRINKLVDLAIAESDHAANAFLQWFVSEQVEEEATTSDIAGRLRLVGGDGPGLLMIDQELAQRALVVPPGTDLTGPLA